VNGHNLLEDRVDDDRATVLNLKVAHPARMYDYYLGGKDNYAADRSAAEEALAVAPELRAIARANRAFLQRAVTYLVKSGIRQFVDIGAGLPTQRNVHQVVQETDPDARVVYVDNDPIVLAHARALLCDSDNGRTRVVQADVGHPQRLLGDPQLRAVVDFAQPMAMMLVSVLQFVPTSDPESIVRPLRDAMVPGSYLVVSHPTQDFRRTAVLRVADTYNRAKAPAVPRTGREIQALFGDFELVEPGLVQAPLWRPVGPVSSDLDTIWMYAGVGCKP
jgi:SAM-dependent methyltransferase